MDNGKFIVTNDEKTRLKMTQAKMVLTYSGKDANGVPYYVFLKPNQCSLDFSKEDLKFGYTDTLFYQEVINR